MFACAVTGLWGFDSPNQRCERATQPFVNLARLNGKPPDGLLGRRDNIHWYKGANTSYDYFFLLYTLTALIVRIGLKVPTVLDYPYPYFSKYYMRLHPIYSGVTR